MSKIWAKQKEARYSGFRIIGPNYVGIMSGKSCLNASFAHQMPLAGKMAFISQSGAICRAVLDLSIRENIGFPVVMKINSRDITHKATAPQHAHPVHPN
jgi:acetyltransferase